MLMPVRTPTVVDFIERLTEASRIAMVEDQRKVKLLLRLYGIIGYYSIPAVLSSISQVGKRKPARDNCHRTIDFAVRVHQNYPSETVHSTRLQLESK